MNLQISNLGASIDNKPILKKLNLSVNTGEVHAIMGPNGAGKSTLSHVLMGNPMYEVTDGQIMLDSQNVLELETHERAQAGLFMAFQYPTEIPGISVGRFLKRLYDTQERLQKIHGKSFIKNLREAIEFMGLDPQFINRPLNEGFSGGEKKRMEIVQMLIMRPSFAVLDETDSGLDIDALQIVAHGINRMKQDVNFGAIVITHYQRILDHIKPDFVHVLHQGRIVLSGGQELVHKLESDGYDWIKQQYNFENEKELV